MKINRNSWHARLYRIWYRRKHRGREYHNDIRPGDTVNLCPYVRIVLLWWWFGYLFKNGRIGRVDVPWISCGVLIVAIDWVTWIYGLKGVTFGTLIAGLIIGAFFSLIYFIRIVGQVRLLNRATAATASFAEIVATRAAGVHERICPTMEVE